MSNKEIAKQFGSSLDKDDFATTRSVLSKDCQYIIGEKILIGPIEITKSYEDNMIAGRKKLDKLEWGTCKIEELSNTEFLVHFTDYLGHKSKEYIHRCKQKVTVGEKSKIIKIEHIADPTEQEQLDNFYKSVGLK